MLPQSYLTKYHQGALSLRQIACLDCLYPKKMKVFNSDSGKFEDLILGCGDCVRCSDRVRNEWCSRMCLHSLSYKFCYYITLTYGSYNLNLFKRHPFKRDWLDSAPIFDNHNYYHSYCWTPSLLINTHLQKFFKRLRKLVPSEISYCACGEYGSSADGHGYGRPHFHAIIWTDSYIKKDVFDRAWSYECVRTSDPLVVNKFTYKSDKSKRFWFSIGNVEYECLTDSGALDWDGVPSVYKSDSAQDCFAYVAKYIGKREKIPAEAKRRIDRVWYHLPIDQNEHCPEDFTPPVGNLPWYNLDIKRCVKFKSKNYEKISKSDFEKAVSPFFVCSRAHAIGKSYALQNLDRFSRGSYKLPKFQGKQLAFPTYFARLVSLKQYPLRVRSSNVISNSLAKCSLPRLYTYYSTLLDSSSAGFYRGRVSVDKDTSPRVKRTGVAYATDLTLCDPELGNVRFEYFPHTETFHGFKFNRHTKRYEECERYDRREFSDMVLRYINDRWDTLPDRRVKRSSSIELFDLLMSDRGRPQIIKSYLDLRKLHSLRYKAHKRINSDKQ